MRYTLGVFIVLFFLNCGTPPRKPGGDIIGNTPEKTEAPDQKEIIVAPVTPDGAVSANFISGEVPFYAYVKNVDTRRAITSVSFENTLLPDIQIPGSYGATLSSLRFPELDRDVLLVNSRLKDPNFNKYYVYILRNNEWKQMVNGFAIHKSNRPDTLSPIRIDPENPNNMLRYYSVFDLDKSSGNKYTWRLLTESVPIKNR
ncbi:hypothetical protein [Constantimarinum furrinae]|uniref:Uncharacterized protein n=1 Tax=Constantimarinum furrinae TaxID=2562285 RepID=A0A7G8PTY2_9FLAO|nr:hypothetical protein [Constantimarinum furrinae]QNJ97798.1 hypothetical protein ALE3EI_1233 [Constantimarinum furrinae]